MVREPEIVPRKDNYKHLLWMGGVWVMQPICLPSILTDPQLSF